VPRGGTSTPELLTVGRVGVDLYPEQIGVPLADVRTFRKMLGGSPTNVAVAAARLGRRAAVITKVGDDAFGPYVRQALAEFGVDPSRVGTDPDLRTPIVFCEIFPPDRFPLLFYREPKAPDMNLRLEDVDLDEVARVPLFWTTGTGLSDEPSRTTTLTALQARSSGITVHDLDYRPMFWASEKDARRLGREALAHATVAVGNLGEVAVVVGDLPPDGAAEALLELGVELAVVKLGHEGVLARTRAERCALPAIPIEVVNGLGAGDAFGGALCHALLEGWELERTISFANAAGALVAGRLGCADDMPTLDEVEALATRGAPRNAFTDQEGRS
jgi:5-dehydro-2-deoxygluconokinase